MRVSQDAWEILGVLEKWQIEATAHTEDPGVSDVSSSFYEDTLKLVRWCDDHGNIDPTPLWDMYRQSCACRRPGAVVGSPPSRKQLEATRRKCVFVCLRIQDTLTRQAAEAPPTPSGRPSDYQGLALKKGTKEVWYRGRPIKLRNRPSAAFAFVLVLAESYPETVMHTRIFEALEAASSREGFSATFMERNEARRAVREGFKRAGLLEDFNRLVENQKQLGYRLVCKCRPLILD